MRTIEIQVLVALFVLSTTVTAMPFQEKGCGKLGCFHGVAEVFKRIAPPAGPNGNAEFKMELVHTNDMHSRFEQTNRMSGVCSPSEAEQQKCFGGFARVSTVIKEAREKARKGETPPVLVLNGGDNFQGSLYYTLFKSEIVTKFINMLQFHALTIGNHEFDSGPIELGQYLRNIKSPIVAANVDFSKCELLQNIDLRPSVDVEVGGQRIGIIGYLTRETGSFVGPCKVEISDEISAVKKEAQRLSDQGIKIIIALGHSGLNVDQQVALEVPEIDLVVGAHSHTFLYDENEDALPDPLDHPTGSYPTFVTQSSGKRVPVVQAYAFTKYIGRLSLTFDADGEMTSIAGKPLLLDKDIVEDPVILDELNIWRDKITYYSNKIEGSTPIFLDKSDCRYKECNIGNVITDSLVYHRVKSPAKDKKGWTDAAIAIINAGNILSSINGRENGGKVTLRDIMDIDPFGQTISLVKLKGDVLIEVLENSVGRYDPALGYNKSRFLQVSGLQVTYNIDNPPGQRVENVLARCAECDSPKYYPVKKDETYSVLTTGYIAGGGEGYDMIPSKGEVTTLEDTARTALKTYFNDMSPVYKDVGFRILIKNSAVAQQAYA